MDFKHDAHNAASRQAPVVAFCQLIQLSKNFGSPEGASHSRWDVQRSPEIKNPASSAGSIRLPRRRIHSKLD